jgi:hypothetical protein
MRRASFLPAIVVALWASAARANGGGYSFGVQLTGSVAPFQAYGTEHVQILEERLDVALRRTEAAVVVRYTMKNVADASVAVRFGFPVEAIQADDAETEDDPEWRARNMRDHAIQQLRGYVVTVDGAPVAAALEAEPFASGKVRPFPGSDALKGVVGWMVSEVVFPAGKPVTMEIRYAADHMGSETSVSEDERLSARTFVYRLSTGAVWKGPIAKGTVTLRADGIPADEVEIAAPRERFKRDGDGWVWSFENLEPTLADDVAVRATPAYAEYGFLIPDGAAQAAGYGSYLERAGKFGGGHRRFKAKASSTLAPAGRYDAQKLAGEQRDRPWAEGAPGDGVGEWVELAPAKPRPLLAIAIWPGYQSEGKPELFDANGRPSRVEIALNDEHRFVATLGDRFEAQLVPILGYAKPVSKLRITILEVYKGTKYADTCISRVRLYDRLEKRPAIRPAR